MPTTERSVLIAIPHYYGPAQVTRRHGSSTSDRVRRTDILRRTIMAIHQALGREQCMMQLAKRRTDAANQAYRGRVRVVVCTDGKSHLLDGLRLPARRFEHCPLDVAPTQLGFGCHDLLRRSRDQADWFGYLEDDLLIHDALLLEKLRWFQSLAGEDALLLPNRFERADAQLATKAYVDGDLPPRVTAAFQDCDDRPQLSADYLGGEVGFARPLNPHSGCFFLSRSQLDHWIAHPAFAAREAAFVGPLESAATLSVMRAFRIYKPVVANAAFLEIEHQSTQFISQLRSERPAK